MAAQEWDFTAVSSQALMFKVSLCIWREKKEETLGLFPAHASKEVQNKTSYFLVNLAFNLFRISYTLCVTVACKVAQTV